jgi:hypothetical protein
VRKGEEGSLVGKAGEAVSGEIERWSDRAMERLYPDLYKGFIIPELWL